MPILIFYKFGGDLMNCVCLGFQNFTSKNGTPCQHSFWAVPFGLMERNSQGMKCKDFYTFSQLPLTVNEQYDLVIGLDTNDKPRLEDARLIRKGGDKDV